MDTGPADVHDGPERTDSDPVHTDSNPVHIAATNDDACKDWLFKHRRDIDGLRSVAVFGVELFHMNPKYLPGGFTGVDMFFVISGFVVTSSLLRPRKQLYTSSGGYFLAFYSRRIKRCVRTYVSRGVSG